MCNPSSSNTLERLIEKNLLIKHLNKVFALLFSKAQLYMYYDNIMVYTF